MSKTNIKSYTDKQLLDKVRLEPNFKGFPNKLWNVAIRSTEDANDSFDDKIYTFNGETFISVSSCTTNKGNKGTAVMCTGLFYDSFEYGLHKQKTPALRQIKAIPYRRDYTADKKTNPTTIVYNDIIYTNIHSASHDLNQQIVKTNIGEWSEGCIVLNDIPYYKEWIKKFKLVGSVTFCLLDEF